MSCSLFSASHHSLGKNDDPCTSRDKENVCVEREVVNTINSPIDYSNILPNNCTNNLVTESDKRTTQCDAGDISSDEMDSRNKKETDAFASSRMNRATFHAANNAIAALSNGCVTDATSKQAAGIWNSYFSALPVSNGLYRPLAERDACGVGCVGDLTKQPSHRTIEDALEYGNDWMEILI